MNRIATILILGFMLIASTAMAATMVVPDSYGTIQAGINACSSGDTVLVNPGTYTENLYYGSTDVVVISAKGADSTTISAANSNYATVRMINATGSLVELNGFTVTGSNYGGIYCVGVTAIIKNNIVEDNSSSYQYNSGGIDLNQTYGSIISGNIIRENTAQTYGSAINMTTCNYDTIRYNLIYDNYGNDEIYCRGTIAAIYNNTIDVDSTSRHGISNTIFGTINCRNNIVVNAPDPYYGIYGGNGGSAIVAYNQLDCDNMYGGDSVIVQAGNSDYSAGFLGGVGYEEDYYDLSPFSSCVDTGDPDTFFNDFDGSRNDRGWRPWNYNLPVLFVPTQYATIQDAIDAAEDEETIVVFPGTYTENIDFLGKEIIVCSDSGADVTTIQASTTTQPVVRIDSNEPKGTELNGFTITGSNYGGIYCYGSSARIVNNIIEDNYSSSTNNGGGIDLNYTSSTFISGNVFRYDSAYTYGSAIHAEYAENDTICYNLIYNCWGYNEIRCLRSKIAIYNNTIDVDGSRFGGISNQLSDTIDCRNNIIVGVPDVFAGVYAVGIYAANGGYARVAYNCIYDAPNGETGGAGIITETGNITGNPLFWGMPADDPDYYDIRPFSPCVDAGDTNSFFNDSDDSRNDMGWKPYYLAAKIGLPQTDTPIPESFSLLRNYPNPFNATTTIEYNIPEASNVVLDVYDILGRHVTRLVDSYQNAGPHTVVWNAGSVTSGTYFYRVQAENFDQSEKMLLLK